MSEIAEIPAVKTSETYLDSTPQPQSSAFFGDFLNYLGPSYGGRVYELETTAYNDFYGLNKAGMTRSGLIAYLKAGKIPYSYFKRHEDTGYEALLKLETNQFRADAQKSLFLLERNDQIVYVAPNVGQAWEDPSKIIPMEHKQNFKLLKEDLGRGLYSIFRRTDEQSDDFEPTAFLEIPIFLSTAFSFAAGWFRVHCTNAIRRAAIGRANKVKVDATIDAVFMDSLFKGIQSTLDKKYDEMVIFKNSLRETTLSANDFLTVLSDMEEKKAISRTVIKESLKHAMQIVEGQSPAEFTKIENWHDGVNILTGKARALPLTSRANCEAGVFRYVDDVLIKRATV